VNETGRVAVVTGVGGGIGAAVASLLAAEGWQVFGLDRKEEDSAAAWGTYLRCDLSAPGEIADTVAAISAQTDRVDTLVNNAALQLNKTLVDTTSEEFELVMGVNLRAPFLLAQGFVPLMRPGSTIVNVSSVHAVATSRGIAAYAASKGAIVALTRAAALELADSGIRLNAVLPGAVDTPMLRAGLARRPEAGVPSKACACSRQRPLAARSGDPRDRSDSRASRSPA
jgi:NAD(P)-dependent dehydrogenase (short-subunit alcohol dehydrogenase family)